MSIGAKILLDSINPWGQRLTTMEVTFPRFVLAEFNTHRVFSRNSASSRAIPIKKMMEKTKNDPVLPVFWGKNQPGMQAEVELNSEERLEARAAWLRARDRALESVEDMLASGVHKQIVNRIMEPWMYTTVIVSSTQWSNFELLRCHPAAQPEIRVAAEVMRNQRLGSKPKFLDKGQWHIPALTPEEHIRLPIEDQLKLATARLARVSYLTHDGVRDMSDDYGLHDRLSTNGHWSPFEHCAQAVAPGSCPTGNFHGWQQYRQQFANESGEFPNGGGI